MSPMIDCLKGRCFQWTLEVQTTFEEIKGKIAFVDVLAFSDFFKIFEVECDASSTRVGGVLSQEGQLVSFHSKKLSGSKLNYSTYDVEFYVVINVLRQWWHYLSRRSPSFTLTMKS